MFLSLLALDFWLSGLALKAFWPSSGFLAFFWPYGLLEDMSRYSIARNSVFWLSSVFWSDGCGPWSLISCLSWPCLRSFSPCLHLYGVYVLARAFVSVCIFGSARTLGMALASSILVFSSLGLAVLAGTHFFWPVFVGFRFLSARDGSPSLCCTWLLSVSQPATLTFVVYLWPSFLTCVSGHWPAVVSSRPSARSSSFDAPLRTTKKGESGEVPRPPEGKKKKNKFCDVSAISVFPPWGGLFRL